MKLMHAKWNEVMLVGGSHKVRACVMHPEPRVCVLENHKFFFPSTVVKMGPSRS
jgi:hypothetical protein